MKKNIFAVLLTCSFFAFLLMPAYAHPAEVELAGPTISELREIFPEIDLDDNGYLTGFCSSRARSASLPDSLTDINNPIYTVYNEEENCTLAIYADGSYSTLGVRSLSNGTIGANQGSCYVYWQSYALYYSLSFYVYHNLSNGLSTITSLNGPIISYISQPLNPYEASMEAVGCGIITATQRDPSDAAMAYASARVIIQDTPTVLMTLYADVQGGIITARGIASAP